ncbi:MAG: tetratricopeptide repeat protein [Phycisphaeraceae bacterium]|nr:tetratricopeptide repeat protein [Phycisphaeraceae bacterium]
MNDPTSAILDAWDFEDPAKSAARFDALAADWERAGDALAAAEFRTQQARAMGLLRRFDEADSLLDGVEAALGGSGAAACRGPDAIRPHVRLLLERGRVKNSSGRAAEAAPLFERAWDVARAAEAGAALDGLAVDAAHMCAIVAGPGQAMEWNRRALGLAESSPNPDARRWRASLLNNIGWTMFAAGDHAAALTHFQRALAARVEQGIDGKGRGAWLVARWCIARTQRALGRTAEALAAQQALLAEHARSGTSDGFVHEELAECLLTLGRGSESRPHFAAAYELLSRDPWFAEREPERIRRSKELARM